MIRTPTSRSFQGTSFRNDRGTVVLNVCRRQERNAWPKRLATVDCFNGKSSNRWTRIEERMANLHVAVQTYALGAVAERPSLLL